MELSVHPIQRPLAATALVVLLGGCASLQPAAGPVRPTGATAPSVAFAAGAASAPASTARAGAAVAPPSASGVPPGTPQAGSPPSTAQPFAAVVRGATKSEGLFTLWQKDEKVWLELAPGDFDKPFFLAPKLETGIGEAGLLGGLMAGAQVIEFRRIHNQVQMVALNTDYTAKAGTPEGRAVAAAFSPSLLASTVVASQPQPERKSILIDANALFVTDMLGVATRLQRAYRQGYAFDGRNSAITALRVRPTGFSLEVLQHFATATIQVRQPGSPPTTPAPTVPDTVPDPRSLFVTVNYSIMPLPAKPMAPRAADARIGYFIASNWDFGDDLERSPVVRYVERWRLEKKDPQAELSEPVKPIVYWLDRTIPLKYRDTIAAGILEWNKAFERIGFKNAIQVKVQADDADFDTLDAGASVRWMTDAESSFAAIGPSRADPRTGEILAANIGIESLATRSVRASRTQVINGPEGGAARGLAHWMQLGGEAALDPRACEVEAQGADQLGYGLDVLQARDEIDPDSPEVERFVLDFLKGVAMHEVGHTLGLRHNFRASRAYSDAQLADPGFTHLHGITGSVMDYLPINLAAPGAPRVDAFQTVLGPYDYWAIEYAYKPIPAAQEKATLERIAARSAEPELSFGTDEDNSLGIDPDALVFDLGDDPVAFARKRLAIARELFKRQENRQLSPDRDYGVLRRSLNFAVNDVARSAGILARQIGGIRTLRDFPGSGRDPLQPVPAAAQREALDQLSRGVFAADSLVVSPRLQRRLAPNFEERADALRDGADNVQTDYTVTERVFAVQRTLLSQLLGDDVAARILDSQGKASKPGEAFQLSELYDRIERDVWSEIEGPGGATDIPAPRRALQREHLNRVMSMLLRPGGAGRADARSLLRLRARTLLQKIKLASARPGLSPDAKAHLQDSADALGEALSAKILRPA